VLIASLDINYLEEQLAYREDSIN